MTVITDSAAILPEELAAGLGVAVVPLRIGLGTESHLDGDIDPEVLIARTEEVTTSGPTPGDFLAALDQHGESGGALILTVSHAMAESTFLAARAAAGAAEIPTRVVDTESAAGGEGLVVLEAARVAAAGGSLDEVEMAARRVVAQVRLVAMLPNLDHLVRSGHVPDAAAWAGRWIGLRPVIQLQHGRVRPLAPALSDEAAYRRVLDAWRRTIPGSPAPLRIAALHSLAPEPAAGLLAAVEEELEPVASFVGSFGTAMLVHSGPGVVGLAWWWDTPGQA